MSNLIALLEIAVLATRLKRLPLYCLDLNYCGFNLIAPVYRWPRTMSQHRSVAWQGLVLYRRSRGARRCRAAPGGAGGGAEGTAPAVVLKGQLRDAASATPAPASPPRPPPRLVGQPPRLAASWENTSLKTCWDGSMES